MAIHVKDFTGEEIVEHLEQTEAMYEDEISMYRMYFSHNLLDKINPKEVDCVEYKLYEFMNREDIDCFISSRVPCETFCVTQDNYHCVMFSVDGLDKGNTYRTMALAHELGHYLDFKHNFKFSRIDFECANSGDGLLEAETIAWAYAKDILASAGFTGWDSFAELVFESLATYTGSFEETMFLIEHINEITKFRESHASFLEAYDNGYVY